MKRFRIILILAVAFIMLFAGNVQADVEELSPEECATILNCLNFERGYYYDVVGGVLFLGDDDSDAEMEIESHGMTEFGVAVLKTDSVGDSFFDSEVQEKLNAYLVVDDEGRIGLIRFSKHITFDDTFQYEDFSNDDWEYYPLTISVNGNTEYIYMLNGSSQKESTMVVPSLDIGYDREEELYDENGELVDFGGRGNDDWFKINGSTTYTNRYISYHLLDWSGANNYMLIFKPANNGDSDKYDISIGDGTNIVTQNLEGMHEFFETRNFVEVPKENVEQIENAIVDGNLEDSSLQLDLSQMNIHYDFDVTGTYVNHVNTNSDVSFITTNDVYIYVFVPQTDGKDCTVEVSYQNDNLENCEETFQSKILYPIGFTSGEKYAFCFAREEYRGVFMPVEDIHYYTDQVILRDYNDDDGIEEVLADFLTTIGKLLIACSNWAAGKEDGTLTLDSIVFDRFEPLKLDFFTYGLNGEQRSYGEGLSGMLISPINRMYDLFRSMAIMGYMVILVYIGIKMMLSSTTAKKKATYKGMFSYWVTGLAILFFFPYVMKYTIELNSTLVQSIGSTVTREVENTKIDTSAAQYSSPYAGDVNEMLKYTADENKDYMSQVGYLAQQTRKLGVAIAFAVLCWQLLMMLVYYYKRVFVVAFLIMIFPLIAFMYVWDKLNDGKSQSFSAWTKEFMVAVFVQSIHAIVYIFVTNSIYGIIDSGNMDFILLICASSFMFSGEEILKQILAGGDTTAMGNVAQTGAKVLAVTKLAQVAGGKIIKNVVGKDGLVRGTYRNLRQAKMHRLMNKPIGGNDDKTGKTPFDLMAQNKTMNANIAPYLPKEGKITPNIRSAAESTYILNNADTQSAASLAQARKDMEKLLKMRNGETVDGKTMTDEEKKQFDAIMQACRFTPQQFNAMNNAVLAGVAMQNAGEKTVNIAQHLQLEFEMIFPETDPVTGKKEVANKMLKATMMDVAARGKSHGYTSKDVEEDWKEKVSRVSEYSGKVKLSGKRSSVQGDKAVEGKVKARSTQIFDSLKRDIPDFDSKTKEEKQALREFAYSLATLQTVKNDASYDAEFYRKNLDVVTRDYGASQAVISKYIADRHVDVVAIDSMIKGSRKETILTNRSEGLLTQYEGQYGPIAPTEREQFEELARKIVSAEQVETGEFNATDMYNAVTGLDNNDAKTQALLRLSNLEMDIDSLRAMLALKIQEESDAGRTTSADEEAVKWAHKTVREARKKQNENDPLTSIYDILGMTYEDGKKNRVSDLVGRAATTNTAVSDFLGKKTNAARVINKNETIASRDMATAVLKEIGVHKRDMKDNGENGEPTYQGYTKEEIKQLEIQERLQGNIGLVRGITALPVTLFTTVAGAAIGAAASDDGMPLGEMFTGAVSGFNIGDSLVTGTELGITDSIAEHTHSSIEKAAAERIEEYKAADEARKDKEDSKAERPEIVSLYGALCQGGDGTLYVDINISAKNAVMMCAGDSMGSAGTGWLPYDAHMNYVLDDQSKNKKHTVYVRIKGPKGDIKIGKIANLSIS